MKYLRVLFALAALAALPSRANAPHLITISGTGAVVRVSTTDQQASSLQFTAPAANSGIARVGDSTTSSSVGEALPAGAGQYLSPTGRGSYSLNAWYVYVANGDTVTILWVEP
jgi:hypothetical protein